jgi:transcriptional antiterminator NusG
MTDEGQFPEETVPTEAQAQVPDDQFEPVEDESSETPLLLDEVSSPIDSETESEEPSEEIEDESSESSLLGEEMKLAIELPPPPDAEEVKAALRDLRVSAMRGAPEGAPDLTEVSDERAWYVVHCYSGYENKVKHNLEQRIESMGMANQIFQVIVPTEEEIEVKEGKRRTVERRVFPGYILVQMLMNDDSWYVVRNTPGVTGFVGMGNKPTPLRPEEVTSILKRMEAEAPKVKVTFKPGQKVRIVDGPFNDFMGTVDEINMDKAKVRVMVSFFGRETPVELDFLQVEKI